jgi:hypothetical protein
MKPMTEPEQAADNAVTEAVDEYNASDEAKDGNTVDLEASDRRTLRLIALQFMNSETPSEVAAKAVNSFLGPLYLQVKQFHEFELNPPEGMEAKELAAMRRGFEATITITGNLVRIAQRLRATRIAAANILPENTLSAVDENTVTRGGL